ncbi:hypothetical protein RRG08_031174 [Elysia crispata]|uniref:Uncharacterized protein n=1 Tax=Elysia crispata TaxID=231223 RepID=A0AAE0ZGK6_9GAST|nr:hypothetical protein RRG08_031174 [Elysia crispata]
MEGDSVRPAMVAGSGLGGSYSLTQPGEFWSADRNLENFLSKPRPIPFADADADADDDDDGGPPGSCGVVKLLILLLPGPLIAFN